MFYQWLICISVLMFGETMLRILIKDSVVNIFSSGWLMSFIFIIMLAFIFTLLLSLIAVRFHVIVQLIMMFSVIFLYTTQIFYHDIFKTFYTFQSTQKIGQGLGFKSVIFSTLSHNFHIILMLFLPILVYVFLYFQLGRNLKKVQISWKNKRLLLILSMLRIALSYSLTLGALTLNKQANELFYEQLTPNLAVEHLGLVTMMRLDTQRYLLGWTPPVEEVFVHIEEEYNQNNNEKSEEDNVEDEQGNSNFTNNFEVEDDTEEEIDYNILEVNFDDLIKGESNDTIKNMHQYFQQVEPTEKNEYTGKYKGYNLIVLTAEAFTYYAIDEDVTPTLYKLSTEGIQFENFYTPIWNVSTSDGEYVALQSLIPDENIWSFEESAKNNLPFVLGNQMKKKGYVTKAYHNHTYHYYGRDKSHPNMGYEYKGIGNGLNVKKVWPASDLEMMEDTIDEYINEEPFHVYYMTVSGHLEYSFNDNSMANKNKHLVEDLPLSNQAKAYMATQIELDKSLEELLDRLEEADVLDNTLIVLSGDHYPYGLDNETIEELSGEKLDEKFEMYKNDLIIYATNMDSDVVKEPASSMDILPTVSNLMGIDYDSRFFMGRDIFSEAERTVTFKDKSFITKKGKYYRPDKKFTPFEDVQVDDDYVDKVKKEVDRQFYYSTKVLEENYYQYLPIQDEE